jgi:hypothetical protein
MMIADDESLWAARKERASRFVQAGADLRGELALPAAHETEDAGSSASGLGREEAQEARFVHMNDDLAQVIEAIATQMAKGQDQSVDALRLQVRQSLDAARKAYRAAGAPYGDTASGFLAWILERRR